MGEEIPLRPLGREDIHKLETALLIGTLLRPDVLKEIKESEERITWIDSLAVAAGALAREKAGMPISRIAEDLGRTESTIRNHLAGKTKAGKLVRETYERIVREGFKLEIPELGVRYEELNKKIEEYEKKIKQLEESIESLKKENKELKELYEREKKFREEISNKINTVRETLNRLKSEIEQALAQLS
ncbi:MAG: transcriptional regulator [Thermoprotei archaeon]|nr:MAG: transcriptional regulator [Thermoprotei archaeon]RLF18108.1 MAG: transcriptional regulator [Thermoprotei archaeon]